MTMRIFLASILIALPVLGQVVSPNPLSPLKTKKVVVLEGGSIDGDHLASRTATYNNMQGFATTIGFKLSKGDPKNLTDANLNDVDILVFNYFFQTQDKSAFPDESKAAFQRWLAKGNKGYIGYHTSGANEFDKNEWVWYQDNVTSMRYILHGSGTPEGKVDKTTDADVLKNPIMEGLPATFTAKDEWYPYYDNSKVLDPKSGCKVMYYLTNAQALDRQPFSPHPAAWFREDAARTRYMYSTFVHFPDGANSTWFKSILLRSLEYVSGDPSTPIVKSNGKSAQTMPGLSFVTSSQELKIDIKGAYKVSIWSPKGKLLFRAKFEGERTLTPKAFEKPGVYMVKIESSKVRFSQQVMVY